MEKTYGMIAFRYQITGKAGHYSLKDRRDDINSMIVYGMNIDQHIYDSYQKGLQ